MIGIILKQRVLFEKDKILTIFTQKFGKISTFMKGARKITSRRNMHAELFNICRFQIYTTKTGKMLVQECTALRTFPIFREDFFRLSAASYTAEIVDRLTAEENPSEEKFILLSETLRALAAPESNILLILAAFILKILTSLGNLPVIPDNTHGALRLCSGQAPRSACSLQSNDEAISSRIPSFLQKTPLRELSKHEFPPQETRWLFLETKRVLSQHIEKKLVCEKFL